MNRAEFLEQAEKIVCQDREDQYGSPENNFGIISELWTAYLQREVTPIDVAAMMCLLKLARIKTGKHFKADSWIDAIGYLACGAEIDARIEETAQLQEVIHVGGSRSLEVDT